MKKHQMLFKSPFLFYYIQMINAFLNSRISANHDKVEGISAVDEVPIHKIENLLRSSKYNNMSSLFEKI